MHSTKFMTICLALLGLFVGQSSMAASADPDAWKFEVTPYMFAAGMKGTTGVNQVKSDVNASFSDIMSNLDKGFMGLLIAQKGRWSFGLEGVYMKLSDSVSKVGNGPLGVVSANGKLDVSGSLFVTQGSVGYRVYDDKTKVDLVGGIRYTKLESDLDVRVQFTPGVAFKGGSRSASISKDWADAIAGVRVLHPVSDKVSLMGYVDAGAGGSDFTYQYMAGVNWEFKPGYVAKLGYRQLYWDYKDNGFVWDMKSRGPYLGLGIQF